MSYPITNRLEATPSTIEFEQVSSKNYDRFAIVSEIFHRVLEPLYGPQAKALKQIEESTDRRCYLLLENRAPSGILVFKTEPSNEFEKMGVTRSIEVKSLFVDQPSYNSGRGLGSRLVEKLTDEVKEMDRKETGIHVTVSEEKKDSLFFFQKKGFSIVHTWNDRYKEGKKEHLLFCPQENYRKNP